MIIAIVILCVCTVIGFSLIADYYINDEDEIVFKIGAFLSILCGVLAIALIVISVARQTESKKEYPASKYTLSYKVTKFEGQRDTTYVIIPKGKRNESTR